MEREGSTGDQMFVAFMGAQKAAEGITNYCPLVEALGLEKKQQPITM